MYEIFDHTADLGLRVRSPSREALFCDAARALYAILIEDPAAIVDRDQYEITLKGDRDDHLLLDWLQELLYRFETAGLLLSDVDLVFEPEGLRAKARGEILDPLRHHQNQDVKAITYHGLRVESTDEGWLAELILDI